MKNNDALSHLPVVEDTSMMYTIKLMSQQLNHPTGMGRGMAEEDERSSTVQTTPPPMLELKN